MINGLNDIHRAGAGAAARAVLFLKGRSRSRWLRKFSIQAFLGIYKPAPSSINYKFLLSNPTTYLFEQLCHRFRSRHFYKTLVWKEEY